MARYLIEDDEDDVFPSEVDDASEPSETEDSSLVIEHRRLVQSLHEIHDDDPSRFLEIERLLDRIDSLLGRMNSSERQIAQRFHQSQRHRSVR